MKVFVALAMLSVAFAADVKPVTLPRAPLPAVETANIVHPEPIDISPLFVPLEVMEAVRQAERAHAVRVVESNDVQPITLPKAEIPEVSESVRVVESVVLPSPEVPAVEAEKIEVIPNPRTRDIVIPEAVDAVRVVKSVVLPSPELPAVETEEIKVIPNLPTRDIVIPEAVDAVRVVKSVVLPSPELPAVETEEINVIPNLPTRDIVIPEAVDAVRVVN